jgi:hypothetical protein
VVRILYSRIYATHAPARTRTLHYKDSILHFPHLTHQPSVAPRPKPRPPIFPTPFVRGRLRTLCRYLLPFCHFTLGIRPHSGIERQSPIEISARPVTRPKLPHPLPTITVLFPVPDMWRSIRKLQTYLAPFAPVNSLKKNIFRSSNQSPTQPPRPNSSATAPSVTTTPKYGGPVGPIYPYLVAFYHFTSHFVHPTAEDQPEV